MNRDRREEPAAQRVVEIVDQVRLVPTDVLGLRLLRAIRDLL
jgi:DNA polymerase III alpha subunit